LERDHRSVEALFEAFADLGEDDSGRAAIVQQIIQELDVHSRIEEEIFYPALRQAHGGDDAEVDQAYEDHQEIKAMIGDLALRNPDDPEFSTRIHELQDAVEDHVGDEEQELFADAEETLGEQALEELGSRLETRKRELATEAVHR
jgi:hemerythrin superfamily protein